MARDVRVILTEILDAIELAREATGALDLAAFESNRIRAAAAGRAVEIVSEAVRHLPQDLTARHTQIPWADIRNIGNKLRHEYHRVDRKILLDIVRYDLDGLEKVIRAELFRAGTP